MKRQRRSGVTKTFSVSVDEETKQILKTLAAERHNGNVSALIAELAKDAKRQAAHERVWAWYGGPEPTAEEVRKIEAEWQEGWALARGARTAAPAGPTAPAEPTAPARSKKRTATVRRPARAKAKAKRAA